MAEHSTGAVAGPSHQILIIQWPAKSMRPAITISKKTVHKRRSTNAQRGLPPSGSGTDASGQGTRDRKQIICRHRHNRLRRLPRRSTHAGSLAARTDDRTELAAGLDPGTPVVRHGDCRYHFRRDHNLDGGGHTRSPLAVKNCPSGALRLRLTGPEPLFAFSVPHHVLGVFAPQGPNPGDETETRLRVTLGRRYV